MKILIDHTALHSTGRALDGTGVGVTPFNDLLQFSNLLLFADKIEISGFEYQPIKDRSNVIRRKLRRIGVSADVLGTSRYSAKRYARLASLAGNRLDQQFDAVFPLYQAEGVQSKLWPDVPGQLQEHLQTLYAFIQRADGESHEAACDPALRDRTFSAVPYILATQPSLLDKVKSLPRFDSTESLNTLTAVAVQFIHEELALDNGAHYAPAWERGRIISEHRDRLESIYNVDVMNQLKQVFTFTSLCTTIAHRAKGEPRAFIEESVSLREQLSEYRRALYSGTDRERQEALRFVNSLADPSSAPSWTESIEFHGFLPFITVKVSKLREAIDHYASTRKYRVLNRLAVESQRLDAVTSLGKLHSNTRNHA